MKKIKPVNMSVEISEKFNLEIAELMAIFNRQFKDLSAEVLNWKPDQTSWSIAQCLEHMIITDNLYLGELDKINDGNYKRTAWHRIPFIPDILGNLLVKTVSPDNKKKVRTFRLFEPTSSNLPQSIINDFLEHLVSMKKIFAKTIKIQDINMVMHSPVNNMITLRIRHVLETLTLHTERHLIQATNVLQAYHQTR